MREEDSVPLSPSAAQEATSCLDRASRGEGDARARLFEILYSDLRAQAAAQLRNERAGHSLQATALVHEAWLRLIDPSQVAPNSRSQFLALASKVMRHILVDHARAKNREKRGGGLARVELGEDLAVDRQGDDSMAILDIDEALEHLRAQSEHLAKIAELRFFGGLSNEETAEALGLSRATVVRDWRLAKAMLSSRLRGQA
jgi:RNA polymerase sigma factor (TIGR02999 family)